MPRLQITKQTSAEAATAVLAFPSGSELPATEPDNSDVCEQRYQIGDIVRDTFGALQELRHGALCVLLDSLEVLEIPEWELIKLLNERPTVVRDLINSETDDLTLDVILGYLEKLQTRL
jgi:hypothetical protein